MRNRVREYYQNNREILIEKARNRYKQLNFREAKKSTQFFFI